jgi:hypothetical protein
MPCLPIGTASKESCRNHRIAKPGRSSRTLVKIEWRLLKPPSEARDATQNGAITMKKVPKKQVAREAMKEIEQLSLATDVRRGLRELVFDEGLAHFYNILEEERCGGVRAAVRKGGASERHGGWGTRLAELVLSYRSSRCRWPRTNPHRQRPDASFVGRVPIEAPFRTRGRADARRRGNPQVRAVARATADGAPQSWHEQERHEPTVRRRDGGERRLLAPTRSGATRPLLVPKIDGLHVAEHAILVALGIDSDGKRHVLGLRESATRNSTSCKALLGDLESRGPA